MTRPTDQERDVLGERLRNAAPEVRYDVAAGLERHRRLLAQGATLPAWEKEVPESALSTPARFGAGSLGAGALGLAVVALVVWFTRSTPPAPVSIPTTTPAVSVETLEASPLTSQGAEHAITTARSEFGAAQAKTEQLPVPQVAPLSVAAQPEPHATHAPTATVAARAPARASTKSDARLGQHPAARSASRASSSRRADRALGTQTAGTAVHAEAPVDGEEVRQLLRAEQLLAPDPLRALQLVRDGNQRFRDGYLRQERRYIEVMALFALGRVGEAQAHAQWFLSEYAAGPYREKVELVVRTHP